MYQIVNITIITTQEKETVKSDCVVKNSQVLSTIYIEISGEGKVRFTANICQKFLFALKVNL